MEDVAEHPRIAALRTMEQPGNNVLRNILDGAKTQMNVNKSCRDRRAPVFPHCDAIAKGVCENRRHEDDFPVCPDCDLATKNHMWNRETENAGLGITMKEILLMRAYYCGECSKVAANPEHWDHWDTTVTCARKTRKRPCENKGKKVYGFDEASRGGFDPMLLDLEIERGGWMSETPLPITGCNCAQKLLNHVLCARHRLFLAQKMIRQAALMQEYRFRRYKDKVCANCRKDPGIDSSRAPDPSDTDRHFWACLVCDGRVASQDTGRMRRIAGGPEVQAWFGAAVPEALTRMFELEIPRAAFERDFDIEQPPEDPQPPQDPQSPANSNDDGEGEEDGDLWGSPGGG